MCLMLAIANISHTHMHLSQQLSILFSRWAQEFLGKNPNSNIHISWVPGHKGITLNELADKEAKWGYRREDAIQASLLYHKEKSSRLVLRRWWKDYQTKAKYSTFWNSTNLPPNTKPSKAFLQLKGAPTSWTKSGIVSVVTWPLPTHQWSENTSSTSAPYMLEMSQTSSEMNLPRKRQDKANGLS